MKAILTVCSLTVVLGVVGAREPESASPAPWGEIRLLSRERSAEVDTYLKSLTAEEMVTAARQACQEVEDDQEEHHDAPAWAAAKFRCVVCLQYYFDKVDVLKGSRALLEIVGNESESGLLRRAIVAFMHGTPKTPFQQTFQTYTELHRSEVYDTLTTLLMNRRDSTEVRAEVIVSLGRQIGKQAHEIIKSDDNVREAVREKRRHTDNAVSVNGLIRSGEVTITEETVEKLKPTKTQGLAYVKLLGAILADDKNEAEELRKHARRRLESYRRSAFTGLDEEAEKALASAGE